jgi:hypothetical protein
MMQQSCLMLMTPTNSCSNEVLPYWQLETNGEMHGSGLVFVNKGEREGAPPHLFHLIPHTWVRGHVLAGERRWGLRPRLPTTG